MLSNPKDSSSGHQGFWHVAWILAVLSFSASGRLESKRRHLADLGCSSSSKSAKIFFCGLVCLLSSAVSLRAP